MGSDQAVKTSLRARLAEIAGAAHVRTVAAADAVDWWPLALKGAALVQPGIGPVLAVAPGTTAEVAAVLRVCAETATPVTPFGGGSGVVGAAIPADGSVRLDLRRLCQIREIDEANLLVTAEAGLFGGELEQAMRARDFTLGLYPQSLDLATLGGWVATRASGTYSGRYGGIEERLAALEAILADGTLIQTPLMPRWAIGPDLKQIFVGAEGTLGVVTAVTLRLSRWPEARLLRAVRFPSLWDGLDAVRCFTQDGLRPAVVRLYDEAETRRQQSLSGDSGVGCLLLLAFDGPARLAAAEEELTLAACFTRGAIDLGREPAARWDANRLHVPEGFAALRQPGVMTDFIDVQAPWDRIEAAYRAVRLALIPHCTSVMAHFSHVYAQGSSIYFVIAIEAGDDAAAIRRYRAAWNAAIPAALSSGGTIAHHHGIGLARAPWFGAALGESWPLWERLKAAFDPRGILNPGKLGSTSAQPTPSLVEPVDG